VSFESLLLLDVVTWTRTQLPNPSPGSSSTVHTDGWQPAHGSWTHGLGSGRVGASNGQGHELAITGKRLIIFFIKVMREAHILAIKRLEELHFKNFNFVPTYSTPTGLIPRALTLKNHNHKLVL
jgi:hypothetical protein